MLSKNLTTQTLMEEESDWWRIVQDVAASQILTAAADQDPAAGAGSPAAGLVAPGLVVVLGLAVTPGADHAAKASPGPGPNPAARNER